MKIKSLLVKKILCVVTCAAVVLPLMIINASAQMSASQECLDLIKEIEGFSQYKYWDYSQWTIGYGTGCGSDEYPNGITESQAEELLTDALGTYEAYVNNFADKYDINLKQNQFDALVSMTYNLGNIWGVYDEFDLKSYLIDGSENHSFLEIAKAFGEWRKAGGEVLQGLVNRRQMETELFLSDRTDYQSEVWRVNSDDGINLREKPDVSSEKTGFMVMNTIFEITEKQTSGDGMLWGKTVYEGKEQWCSLDYSKYMVGGPLDFEETNCGNDSGNSNSGNNTNINENVSETWKITSESGVKIRKGPGLNYDQIGHIKCGNKIKVTATAECDGYLWGKTSYDGIDGWCTLDFAERVGEQELEGAALQSIYISSKPDKLTYNEGEALDLTGIEVTGVYSDGSKKIVTDIVLSGYEPVAGTHTVTVTYMEKTASFRVTVNEKQLSAIKLESGPEKTIYKMDEGFSPKGIKLVGIYDNNTQEEITDYYLNNIKGFSATAGVKTIEIEYGGFKEYFRIEVSEKSVEKIEINKLPDKLEYIVGQELDTSGMEVLAYYDNNTSEKITGYSVSGFNSQIEGTQEIKVGYNNIYVSFEVSVSQPDIFSLPGDIDGSGARDIFDLIILNRYIDGIYTDLGDREYLADVDGNGIVNKADIEALSRIVSEQ